MQLVQDIQTEVDETLILRAATWDDLTAVLALCDASAIAEIGRPEITLSRLREEWRTPDFDLARNTRVVTTADDKIVGYVEVWDLEPLPVTNWVWGRTYPGYEGRGIGTLMMDWVDRRMQETRTRVPDDLQVVYRSGTVNTNQTARAFLESRGMHPIRSFYRMVIELDGPQPAAVWPDHIRLSTLAEQGDLPAVYRAFNDAFTDHWGHVEQPEEHGIKRFQHWIDHDQSTDPAIWYLAMDGSEIAAVCLCSRTDDEDPEMGWVNILGVRRPWRRQGLGLSLLHHAFGEFQKVGRKRAGLGVDASSLTGATRLYERAGMHVARQFVSYETIVRHGRDVSLQTLEA